MHEQFLLAALSQAQLGRGICAPNPSVGAVAVSHGSIIAQAWHQGAGTPHAEQLLLQQLPKNSPDITLYVTLEPCNHWGKTPPCVDAIVAHGIKKVVYAYRDPNPLVMRNDTSMLLSMHGITGIHYPIPEIDAFYESYRYWTLTKKPWVTVKLAHTLDGKIGGLTGHRIHLSNDLCAEFTHKNRLHSDVILTTAVTVNRDDPLLNARVPTGDVVKPVAIIDRKGVLNPDSQLLKSAKHCHIYYEEGYPIPSIASKVSCYAMSAMEGRVDLAGVIRHLGDLGYHDVWVEAGGRLFTALHQARLVNRTHLYIVPQVLGENATAAFHSADIFNQAHHITWQPMGHNMIASLSWMTDAEEAQSCLQDIL